MTKDKTLTVEEVFSNNAISFNTPNTPNSKEVLRIENDGVIFWKKPGDKEMTECKDFKDIAKGFKEIVENFNPPRTEEIVRTAQIEVLEELMEERKNVMPDNGDEMTPGQIFKLFADLDGGILNKLNTLKNAHLDK